MGERGWGGRGGGEKGRGGGGQEKGDGREGGEGIREDIPVIIIFKLVNRSYLLVRGHVFEGVGVVVELFEAGVRGAETHCSFEFVARFVVVAGFEGGVGRGVGGALVHGTGVEGSRDGSLASRKGAGEDDGDEAGDGGESPHHGELCEHG